MESSRHWPQKGGGEGDRFGGRGRFSSLEQWHSEAAGTELPGKRTLNTGEAGAGGQKSLQDVKVWRQTLSTSLSR